MQAGWIEPFMSFDELVEDRAYELVHVFTPMPFKGATGLAGGPIAVT